MKNHEKRPLFCLAPRGATSSNTHVAARAHAVRVRARVAGHRGVRAAVRGVLHDVLQDPVLLPVVHEVALPVLHAVLVVHGVERAQTALVQHLALRLIYIIRGARVGGKRRRPKAGTRPRPPAPPGRRGHRSTRRSATGLGESFRPTKNLASSGNSGSPWRSGTSR